MARAQNGDTGAFGELYDRHAVSSFQVARGICGDAGRAESAVQEAFLTIWHSRAHFRLESGSFKGWLTRVVIRAARDQVVGRSETGALLASLRELPEAQAEVIALAYFGELSHAEIAVLLEIPSGTVKGRMRLGLEKLRKQMGALT
ncbi:MAG TPA: RNA polymerase sigma factor [Solirubrobacterales bacterium]|nr:RNA polymerase sigma factor [Solirubrobacterales bacterium]